jgi:hypothetical protein
MGYTWDDRVPFRDLGKANDFSILRKLKRIDFSRTVRSSYAPLRLEKWYGYGSNLQSIKDGRVEVGWTENFPDWIDELRVKYFPEANSALICKGQRPDSETSIDWHRDHGTFENHVVMINFGYAVFYIQDYYNGTEVITLKDGHVVEFDSKLLHKSTQSSDERYIITFRRVKTEFSKHKLF